jgi:hypothetical protein
MRIIPMVCFSWRKWCGFESKLNRRGRPRQHRRRRVEQLEDCLGTVGSRAAASPPAGNGTAAPAGQAPAGTARHAPDDRAKPRPQVPPSPGSGAPADCDIHAELCRRIQGLKQERETRWQKLLTGLLGKRGGD